MNDNCYICYSGGQGRIVEKKSEFIADIIPAESEIDAVEFIERIRKKYYDARHHCYAYITDNGKVKKFSDDGEPSQTAGKPMMDILENAGVTNICAVVTRYFGGTLLGTGGLVRAYQGACKEGLNNCVLKELKNGFVFKYNFDYDFFGKLSKYTEGKEIYIIDSDFSDSVTSCILTETLLSSAFPSVMGNLSNAKAKLLDRNEVKYIILNGKPEIRK